MDPCFEPAFLSQEEKEMNEFVGRGKPWQVGGVKEGETSKVAWFIDKRTLNYSLGCRVLFEKDRICQPLGLTPILTPI